MLLSFKIERVVIQVDSSKWMTCLLKAIILRVRDEWETAKAWKKVRPVLHPGEDWGGHGFSLPFLPSTVTCDLVPSLRKQLNYVSETMFWPCWNRSSKIQVLWGSYYTADTARELSCGLNFLTVCVFHCCSEKMEALGVCCSQNWLWTVSEIQLFFLSEVCSTLRFCWRVWKALMKVLWWWQRAMTYT